MIVEEFLQTKYFQDISLLGLKVYSSGAVPEDVKYPYILIGEIQAIQRINPCPMWTCYVTVDIVTGDLSPIGRKQMFDLASSIEGAINVPGTYESNGYKIYNTYLQNSLPLEESGTFGYIYRNLRTYVHQIGQS